MPHAALRLSAMPRKYAWAAGRVTTGSANCSVMNNFPSTVPQLSWNKLPHADWLVP